MLFSGKKKKIEEAQKRTQDCRFEILPLLNEVSEEEVDEIEDLIDDEITKARKRVNKLNGGEHKNNSQDGTAELEKEAS